MISDGAIRDLVEEHRTDLEQAARALVDAANRGGGEDNITVVAFEIVGGGEELEETVRMEAPAADATDDEDTLSGIDAIPAVDTMVVRPDEVERLGLGAAARETHSRAARERPRSDRSARVRLVLAMVLMLAVVTVLVVWGLLH